jgi:hypothetical protein
VVEAGVRERMPVDPATARYAAEVARHTAHLATSDAEWAGEEEIASTAAVVAVRRHGRPAHPSDRPRPLAEVGLLVGSGGVLRHAPAGMGDRVLSRVTDDHGGGWRVPDGAHRRVDTAYVLFAVGLLADGYPAAAAALAAPLAAVPPQRPTV